VLDFTAYPTHARYRTLKLSDPRQTGLDVYALQNALADLGDHANPGPLDGILGPQTAKAIRAAQEGMFITVDGLAGGGTQTALARHLAARVDYRLRLPAGLLLGQLMTESGCRLGNYSPRRPDGTYDAGVAQRNTQFTPPRDGFTVLASIDALGVRLRTYYDRFAGVAGRRRWELAAGSWNAPAFASYIAREEGATGVKTSETLRPSDTARATLEAYMDSATAMMA
jgi:hypothetical protein